MFSCDDVSRTRAIRFQPSVVQENARAIATCSRGRRPADLSRACASPRPPDFGFAPTERVIADTFREQAQMSRTTRSHGIDEAHPDCSGADEVFATIRAMVFLGRHLELAAQISRSRSGRT